MPLKAAVKIGCSNFRYHPIRLAATIILSVIAFSLLSITLTISLLNPQPAYINAIFENKLEYTAIYKYKSYMPNIVWEGVFNNLDGIFGYDLLSRDKAELNYSDIETLEEYGNITPVYDMGGEDIYSFQKWFYESSSDKLSQAAQTTGDHYALNATGYMSITEQECNRLGFSIKGRLPQTVNEVAISDCLANTFICLGLKDDNGKIYQFNSVEDLIGNRIPVFSYLAGAYNPGEQVKVITGVVDTGCDGKCGYAHLKSYENYHDKIYVCKNYTLAYSYVLCPVSESKAEFTDLANYIFNYKSYEGGDEISYRLSNSLSKGFYNFLEYIPLLKMASLYLAIIFIVFSIIFMLNFVGTSIRGQMKQIGIISSLGAGKKEIYKIYGSGVYITFGIVFIIVNIASVIILGVLDKYLTTKVELLFSVLSFNPAVLFILLGIIGVFSTVGLLVPLMKMRKLSPSEIILRGRVK